MVTAAQRGTDELQAGHVKRKANAMSVRRAIHVAVVLASTDEALVTPLSSGRVCSISGPGHGSRLAERGFHVAKDDHAL